MRHPVKEMELVLALFKRPQEGHSASSLSRVLNISPMGALKIVKRLERERILSYKQVGQAKIYNLKLSSDYVKKYLSFLLHREAELSSPYIRRWITELKKIKSAEIILLFGSILKKEEANDIDVLFVISQKKFLELKKEINELNLINNKKIHPLFQSESDLRLNIQKEDKIILNALKGLLVIGDEKLIEIIKNEPR